MAPSTAAEAKSSPAEFGGIELFRLARASQQHARCCHTGGVVEQGEFQRLA
jgi:hypothetical protein